MASGKKTAKKPQKPKTAGGKQRKPTAKAKAVKPARTAAKKTARKAPPPRKPKAPPRKPAPKPGKAKAAAQKPAPPAPKAPPRKAPPPKPPVPAPPKKAAAQKPAPTPPPAPATPAPAPSPPATTKKRKPIPVTTSPATPVFRPLAEGPAPVQAPPPPPAKPGHVDHQMLSAIAYGLFAAINKAFGFAGQSVVKNASLRILEFGYKRGWLPPRSREPVKALNEFFGRLETMGYAERIHVGRRGDGYVLEVTGLADFDALHELRALHYPLLPLFLGEMTTAIVDQYFGLRVTTGPMEIQETRRGLAIPFQIHEPPAPADPSRLIASYRIDDFEE